MVEPSEKYVIKDTNKIDIVSDPKGKLQKHTTKVENNMMQQILLETATKMLTKAWEKIKQKG